MLTRLILLFSLAILPPSLARGSDADAEAAEPWVTALVRDAQTAMEAGDYAAAESYGRTLTRRAPQNPVGWRVLALSLERQGDKAAALAVVEEGLTHSPSDDGLLGLRRIFSSNATGGIELDTSKLKKIKDKKEEDDFRPKPRPPQEHGAKAGDAEKMLPAQMSRNAQPMQFYKPEQHSGFTRRGLEKMQGDDLIGGIREFTQALKKNPRDEAALRWRALAREKAGDHEGAIEDAERALALNAQDPWAHKTHAMALLALKKAEAALAAANKAIDANGTDADAYRIRAMVHQQNGDRAAMIQDLAQAASLDPAFAALYRRELGKAEKEIAAEDGEESEGGDAAMGTAVALGALILGGGIAAAFAKKKKPAGAIKSLRAQSLEAARAAAALKHPNILEIHSVQEEKGGALLVLEHIEGSTLEAILGEHQKLSPAQAVEIARQTAAALDYAHAQGVLHLNLTPGGILIAGDAVKVADFAVAREAEKNLYAAPEQLSGGACAQSDVYALGLCFYEMLTGTRARPQEGFAPLTELIPGIAPGLDGVLAYTFDADPAKRYPTAGQFAAALATVVGVPSPDVIS